MSWLKKPVVAALLLVSMWTVCRLVWLRHTGIPEPEVPDEFVYLLGADTFAHGRMTNPAHPLGRFFESPYVLVRPTYASKYPPGQSMFLAIGQVLLGEPFYGVTIGNALMLFSMSLMLFAWVPYRWALTTSVMIALCLQPEMYWANSYWGGSVAASGGALVLLSLGIYLKRQTWLAGVVFAFGALLLFWTRPFEGGIFTVALLLLFGAELWRKRRPSVLPAAMIILVAGAAWTASYNRAVTGSALRLPFLEYQHQYNATPQFWFLPPLPEPVYTNPRIAAELGMHGSDAKLYLEHQPWATGLKVGFSISLRRFLSTLGVAVLLTMLIPVAWRDPVYRKMAIVTGLMLFLLAMEIGHFKHYIAPVWAAQALMIAIWAERAWTLRIRNQPVGAMLTALVMIVSPAAIALQGETALPRDWVHWRTEAIQRVSARSRPQLLIVHYKSPDWGTGFEGVYNGADIDRQHVILAHDLGPEEDRDLLHYYPDREISILTFDTESGKLQTRIDPYPPNVTPQSAAQTPTASAK